MHTPTSAEDTLPGWSWGSPDACTHALDGVRAGSARCEELKELPLEAPFGRDDLLGAGIEGIEFAAFRTSHPNGLAADYVPVRSGDATTSPGRMFRIDGTASFVQVDISRPLPFAAASVDWVYAEHLLEHVTPDTAIGWLRELRRILVPGGLLRLSTPDLAIYARHYLDGGPFFAEHRERMREALAPAPPMPARPAFMVNQIFYFYGHRWIYDEAELRYALGAAGFDPDAVRRRSFRVGERDDVAALDSEIRSDESIYVEVRG
jgi:predicted SAM-dependent methyltransferase